MSVATADVLAARSGDHDAFARLVRSHAGVVCGIATAILGDAQAAEEVSQEVFVHAWHGLGSLREPASFSGWLRQLARNRSHDAVRRQMRRREVGDSGLAIVPDPALDVGERLDGYRREAAMWEALEELTHDDREVLVLYYREGRSAKQVADLLDLREPAVRKRLSRAREVLRQDVRERLSAYLDATRPGSAFAVGVATAIAAAAPSTAAAATGGLVAAGGKAALSGAALGAGLGLLGVWSGFRMGSRSLDDADRRRLRRHAILQTLAVVGASACFLLLPPLIGVLLGMTLLAAVVGATVLSWPLRLGGVVGVVGGLAAGTVGAVAGLSAAGVVDVPLGAALHVQVFGFVAVPLVVGLAGAAQLGVKARWLAVGAVSWVVAAPFLALGSFLGGPTSLGAAIGLSLAAGLFEESSRAALYALLAWRGQLGDGRRAVILGLGHGGVESLLFGAGTLAWIASGSALGEPADHALYGLSRPLLILVHVGFTLLVWQAVRDRRAGLWLAAVLLHVGLDLAAFVAPLVWPSGGLAVGGATVLALAAGSAVVARRMVTSSTGSA